MFALWSTLPLAPQKNPSHIISQLSYVELCSTVNKPFNLTTYSGQFLVQIGGIEPNRNMLDKTLMALYEAGGGKWADFLGVFKNHLWLKE